MSRVPERLVVNERYKFLLNWNAVNRKNEHLLIHNEVNLNDFGGLLCDIGDALPLERPRPRETEFFDMSVRFSKTILGSNQG